jgi:hypothetical protein
MGIFDKLFGSKKSISQNNANINKQQKTIPNASYSKYISSCFDLKGLPDATRCSNNGDKAFEAGNLEGAITWWIRSCALQRNEGIVFYSKYYSKPFYYLSSFARQFELESCQKTLFANVDNRTFQNICTYQSQSEIEKIKEMAKKQGTDDMKNAIKLLCQEYLKFDDKEMDKVKKALKDYWHFNAKIWWEKNLPKDPICDACPSMKPLTLEKSYLSGGWMRCETCADRSLKTWDEENNKISYFGEGEIDRALRHCGIH